MQDLRTSEHHFFTEFVTKFSLPVIFVCLCQGGLRLAGWLASFNSTLLLPPETVIASS